MTVFLGVLLVSFLASFLLADTHASLSQWVLDENYQGAFQSNYQNLKWRIPNLMRQTLIDISVRTGLSFQDGWNHPLTVKFTDQAPGGHENILAYVQLFSTDTNGVPGFAQELNINMAAYEREQFDFEKVLAHELTHAMLNDLLGGEAAQVIPTWFHEGLAVYAADQGETMLKAYVYQFSGSAEQRLLNGLDGPHGALDYAEDYLAFNYIQEKYSSNGLHNFIQEVLKRKGDIPNSLDYTCNVRWDEFQRDLLIYSKEKIKEIGPVKRGQYEKPY